MKIQTRMKRWTTLLLALIMVLSAVPIHATTTDKEPSATTEVIVYAGSSSNRITSDAFTVEPGVSSNWGDREARWVWSGNALGCEQLPLYTSAAGATFTFDMGTIVSGEYEVAYFTLAAGAPEMLLEIKEGDNTIKNVTVPAYSETNTAGWLTVGRIDVSGNGNITVNYTNPSGIENARATGVKLTLVDSDEFSTATESIVYAAANDSQTLSDAFTGTPAIGGGWGQHEEQWVWSPQKFGCEQYPLYTYAEGATFSFDMGKMIPGTYEVAYFTIEAPAPEMMLEVKEGDTAIGTVTVPEYSGSDAAGWMTIGTVEVEGTDKVTVNYTNPTDTGNARATGVKLTLLDAVGTNDIVKNATIAEDCSKSDDGDLAWDMSYTIKNYDGNGTLYNAEEGATLIFNTTGMTAGNYKVYYWVTPHQYNIPEMQFNVTHNSKTSELSAPIGADAPAGWYYMGTLDFSGDGSEMFEFVHPGEAQARATAIRLIPTDHVVYIPVVEQEEETPVNPPEEELIDVDPYPGFYFVGDWATSNALTGPMSKSKYSMWISKERIDNSQEPFNNPANNYCHYQPDLQVAAGVNISVYLLHWNTNQADDIVYEVHHNGEVDTFHIDLTTLTESCWYDLGTFDFSGPEETNFVRIVCTDADNYEEMTNFRASTIRFDVLNDAASGGIWQTIYVTPSPTAEIFTVAELDHFEDIADDDVAKYDVEYMYHEGYITGTTETTFSPDENIVMADFVTYLSNVLGLQEADASVVEVLLEGTDENESLTKEEAARILYNALIYLNKNVQWLHSLTPDYTKLSDAEDVSDWAKNAMDAMYRCGVVTITEGALVPQKVLTRSEAVVMLKQFTQQFVNAGPVNDDGEDWVLTFNDEFSGTELDSNVWTARDENPGHILSSRHPENAEVHDGALYLMTKYESKVEGKNWTTANVLADKGAFAQEYGYWECRYKFTETSGINNSFWIYTDVWGMKGYEIDVCEGHYMNKINNTYHEYTIGNNESTSHSKRSTVEYDLSADFHTYAVEWTPDTLKFYFDGELTYEQQVYHESGWKSFARLSTAVLSWAGTITQEADGTAQIVDYVRVWQRSGDVAGHTEANEHALDNFTECTLEKVEQAPTCTLAGYQEHWKCAICNKRFADAAGTEAIDVADVTVAALGGDHTVEKVPGKVATCTETGLTEGEKCTICGTLTTAQIEISVVPHTIEKVPGKAATTTETGLTEGEKCSVCGSIITAQIEIPVIDDSDKDTDSNEDTEESEDADAEDVQPSDEVGNDSNNSNSIRNNNSRDISAPATGDTSNGMWALLIMIVSGIVMLIMMKKVVCKVII